MKRNPRLAAALLALAIALCAVPVSAYSSGALLPQERTYRTAFADTKGTWCDAYVQTVYEAGLMDGKTAFRFDPAGTLTYAHITAITARLHELLNGGDGKFRAPAAAEAWYQPYYDYLEQLYLSDDTGKYSSLYMTLGGMEDYAYEPCDRYDFVWMLSAVLPTLPKINSVTALPDAGDGDVLAFYNAGILTGTDEYGAFCGTCNLNRGQAAAMLARIADPAQRVKFTQKPFSYARSLLGAEPASTVLTVDGFAVSAELYALVLAGEIAQREFENGMAYYDTYAQYLDGYYDDANYYAYETFSDYLLAVHGIDTAAESAVQWNVPDKGGLTPAQKVRADALDTLTQIAQLFVHQSGYPLTAAQQTALSEEVETELSYAFGISETTVRQILTAQLLLSNMSRAYAPAASQMSGYLADYGCFYGRWISIGYDISGGSGWYDLTQAEALTLAQSVRAQAAAHVNDPDYFSYLCWKYDTGDGSADESLLYVDELSQADQAALRDLPIGSVSSLISQEITYPASCDGGDCVKYGTYNLFLKGDPSRDEDMLSMIGSIPAYSQLSAWAGAAKATTSAAYDGFDVAALALQYDALEAQGFSSPYYNLSSYFLNQ